MPERSIRRVVAVVFVIGLLGTGGHQIIRLAAQAGEFSVPSLKAPLSNPIVNNTDTTARDTQSTSTVLNIPGTSTVVAAYTDSSVYTGSNNHLTSWSVSTNDGANWVGGGALPDSAAGDGGNPVLARDNTSGRLYLSTPAFTATSSTVQIFRSDNNATSWLAPVNAFPGFAGNDNLSTPRVIVDNFGGTGQGYVYVVARNVPGLGGGSQASGVYLSRSIDGGATFQVVSTPTTGQSGAGTGPNVLVGTDHAVYVFWWINIGSPVIRLTKSTNFGTSNWSAFITAATLTGPANGDLGLTGGFRTNSFPQVAVNTSNGAIEVIYNDKNGTDKADVYNVESLNGGTNWDTPFRLNNDSAYTGDRDQFMPAGTLTPDGQHFMLTWYDRRGDPGNGTIERWGVIGTLVGGQCCAITPNFRISTGGWPAVVGQDASVPANYMVDYDTMSASNTAFYVTWSDNRLSSSAPHTNQPDVRFAKISVFGPPPEGDLDRDFQTDRTVFRGSTGTSYSLLSNGGATSTAWGTSGDIDLQVDVDGDAKGDVAVWRPSTGTLYAVYSSNGAVATKNWGTSGDIPLAGDINGDGKDDFAVFRPSTGKWYITDSEGHTDVVSWGTNGDQPLLTDNDGDGAMELTVFRPSTGVWYTLFPFSFTTQVFNWGTNGDIPVPGDFDGDGKSDRAVFRPSTGEWFVRRSSNGSIQQVTWGTNGDYPLLGDQDNDGKSDFIVWRPSSGTWYTQYAAGGFALTNWGANGDKPGGRVPGS